MKLLAFGIHPDDVELGCGGTIALSAHHGHEVTIVDLTRGESSSNGTPEERAREAEAAARILGCGERRNLGLPDAGVRSEDPEQRLAVVRAIRTVRPRVVLVPNGDDPHPDHACGARLVEHALYLAGIHGYDRGGSEAWRVERWLAYSGRRPVRADVVVDITPVYEAKRRAIAAHRTQFEASEGSVATPLNVPDFLSVVEARDSVHGRMIGVRWGEAYQSPRPVGLGDLGLIAPEDVG